MYIRTKDRIFKVTNDKYGVIEENGVFKIHCENMGHHWYSELDVIAKSENLAELCDEFVLFDKPFNTYGVFDKKVINYKWLKEHRTIYPSKLCIIYGAIWTNKGLIYVAKMNDKGELICL